MGASMLEMLDARTWVEAAVVHVLYRMGRFRWNYLVRKLRNLQRGDAMR